MSRKYVMLTLLDYKHVVIGYDDGHVCCIKLGDLLADELAGLESKTMKVEHEAIDIHALPALIPFRGEELTFTKYGFEQSTETVIAAYSEATNTWVVDDVPRKKVYEPHRMLDAPLNCGHV